MTTNRDLTVALVGDLFVDRPDPESIFAHSASYLREADIAFGNLEGVITDIGEVTPVKAGGRRVERMEERAISAYTYAGFDMVSMANNHPMNLGAIGLQRSLEVLDAAGIAHVGAGRNLEEARRPAILDRNHVRVAFLAYSSVFDPSYAAAADRPGLAPVRVSTSFEPQPRHAEVPGSPPLIRTFPDQNDTEAMVQDVQRAKELADVVIVSWHWGISRANGGAVAGKVIDYQVWLGHKAIDAGADVIVGHHPHVLEGVEVYRGKVIFYSLGNFAFDHPNHQGEPTVLARCQIDGGSIRQVSVIPFLINEDAQPVSVGVDSDHGRACIELLREQSGAFGTEFRVVGNEVIIEAGRGALVEA